MQKWQESMNQLLSVKQIFNFPATSFDQISSGGIKMKDFGLRNKFVTHRQNNKQMVCKTIT